MLKRRTEECFCAFLDHLFKLIYIMPNVKMKAMKLNIDNDCYILLLLFHVLIYYLVVLFLLLVG